MSGKINMDLVVEAKKEVRTYALKGVKRLFTETAGMLYSFG